MKHHENNVWRWERDSNPRYAQTYTHFPGVLLKPLGHLTKASDNNQKNEICQAETIDLKQKFLCGDIIVEK